MIKRALTMAIVASILAACSTDNGALTQPKQIAESQPVDIPASTVSVQVNQSNCSEPPANSFEPDQIVFYHPDSGDLQAIDVRTLRLRTPTKRVAAPINLSAYSISNAACRLPSGMIAYGRLPPTRQASVPTAPAAVQ